MSQSEFYDQIEDESNEVFVKFQSISNKLKKRFLRKPNIAEATEQYTSLATHCEQKELWEYAGLCWLAAAHCQDTLCNIPSELDYLMQAGQQFITAEEKNSKIGVMSLGAENLQAAISCFEEITTKSKNHGEFATLTARLAVKMSLTLGSNPSGVQQLKKAIDILPTPRVIKLLASYYIAKGDYMTALNTVNDLIELVELNNNGMATGNYYEIIYRSEVTRLLLLLILQPSPKLPSSLVQVLEKYAWIEDGINVQINGMCEDELLILQSLVLMVMGHQTDDRQNLIELEGELWSYLDVEQKGLLRKLVKSHQ